jgi:hypothetical protein
MDTLELANVTADPIQVVGMSFYFDPFTVELAKQRGLHRFQFYGLGRGGVLGDVDRRRLTRPSRSSTRPCTTSCGTALARRPTPWRRPPPTCRRPTSTPIGPSGLSPATCWRRTRRPPTRWWPTWRSDGTIWSTATASTRFRAIRCTRPTSGPSSCASCEGACTSWPCARRGSRRPGSVLPPESRCLSVARLSRRRRARGHRGARP